MGQEETRPDETIQEETRLKNKDQRKQNQRRRDNKRGDKTREDKTTEGKTRGDRTRGGRSHATRPRKLSRGLSGLPVPRQLHSKPTCFVHLNARVHSSLFKFVFENMIFRKAGGTPPYEAGSPSQEPLGISITRARKLP